MTVNYMFTTRMTIIFDNEFKIDMVDNFDNAVKKIEWAMDTYGFETAEVINPDTGELFITAREGE